MAEGDQDPAEKTEEPTQKRLEDAQKKGQTFQSREINSFMILFAFALMLAWSASGIMTDAKVNLAQYVQRPDAMPVSVGGLADILSTTVYNIGGIMLLPLLIFVAAALFGGFAQRPLVFSLEPLKPKWEKVSPAKGLKRMFSLRAIMEFLKGLVKISIIGVVAFLSIWPWRGELLRMTNTELPGLLQFMHSVSLRMLIGALIILFFIAALDYFYQRYEFYKNMRMSRKEIKDEHKQQEGDPIVKQRLRQIRMERARRRMMANVPTADVVITNPTHYAVALKYEQEIMQAPAVVAKGTDKVALRIREMAKENDVPIVENKPLARALFEVDLDETIPLEHYQAVAEIISYVYRLKGKQLVQTPGINMN
jgi:flagellar biosynthetic protein FlhB